MTDINVVQTSEDNNQLIFLTLHKENMLPITVSTLLY